MEVAYGRVRVVLRDDPPNGRGSPTPVTVAAAGTYPWPEAGSVDIQIRERVAAGEPGFPGLFDADRLVWPLVLRARRPGDRMRPRGGRGGRRLSDLMIDAKIARDERGRLPILTAGDGEILFVPGLRPAEVGRPTASTRRSLHVHFQPAR